MRVLKVVAEGITTSFRYPHFMQQIHPTYEMPPPATIYGHIASALGEWFDPNGVRFAYNFKFTNLAKDVEHIIVLAPSTGKLKGTKIDKVLEGKVNPFSRDLLFQPHLTLYVNRPDWKEAFRNPHYAVVLGRSQDLFTYTNVSIIDLRTAEQAYFEHTLLPYSTHRYTSRGYAITMPRFVDYRNKRQPAFSRYFIVRDRLDSRQDFLWIGDKPSESYWIDPTSPEINGAHLGLAFLGFTQEEHESVSVAE